MLKYDGLGWGDAEIEQLARVIDAVAEPIAATDEGARRHSRRAADLNELYLKDNAFGDAAARTLLDAAAKLRGLTWLNLSGNACLGDDAFAHLATLLGSNRLNFKRLREVRLIGTSAGAVAISNLEKACAARKVQLKTAAEALSA